MTKYLICTHGRFGEELIKSAEMIGGSMKNVTAVSLLPEMSPEDYGEVLEKELLSEGLNICFADLFGGTPCNTILKLSQTYPIELLCGINLPMLLEAVSMDNFNDIQEYKAHLLSIYAENGFDVLERLKKGKE